MVSDHPATGITILGSGTCVPSLERSACAALVEAGGEKILVDSGPGTMRRLLQAGVSIFDVAYVCYSHFHPDHTGELVPFLFSNKYAGGTLRRRPLTVFAGRGFVSFFDGLRRVYGRWIDLDDSLFRIEELDNREFEDRAFAGFRIQSVPVAHNKESLAYRFTGSDDRSVVISGDTDYSENLVRLAENADVFVCEASLPDEQKVDGHLTPSLAGEIASRARVRTLVLTHFYPECDAVDVEAQCRKTYGGPLFLAVDLMRIRAGS
jgi:ribonuclease BN (tRNA processing enzyme)